MLAWLALALICPLPLQAAPEPVRVDAGPNLSLEFDTALQSRLLTRADGAETPLDSFRANESVVVDGKAVTGFQLKSATHRAVKDKVGKGVQYVLIGETPALREELTVTVYPDFPGMIFLQGRYTNLGANDLHVDRWRFQRHLPADATPTNPPFWSYQSGSYENRPDWVLPVQTGFEQQNFMGMNSTDYGGGTPISDVWRRDVGIGIGHVELTPKLVSLPVTMYGDSGVDLGIEESVDRTLKPGESLTTLRTFVTVHHGDYFHTLAEYRRFMVRSGVHFPTYAETPYQPVWCGWGYGRRFTPDQIYGALPKAAALGFKWAVIDDGWQNNVGDWQLNPAKFPNGDADMRRLTAGIRARGLRPEIWWSPMSVHPDSALFKAHPDYLLINKSGKPQRITYWNADYLCPAYKPVQEYTKALVIKMLRDWDFDGIKLDGQHLNAAPPCYNPAHHHADPNEAYEQETALFKVIFDTARRIKPDAVIEFCPCGDAYAFHNLPFMNQSVASDPESSWQIRTKGKTLKALMGPSVAYLGDYVELSDGGNDFASTVGVGGVVGSMFRWPPNSQTDVRRRRGDLTADMEPDWQKWVAIYNAKMLSKGEYLGELYDIGFDRPETHAIRKDGRMYYAFYANSFSGPVELRGLEARAYHVHDYVNDKDYGVVQGPTARLSVEFQKHLLLEAMPEE